jgi:hypothetical protein
VINSKEQTKENTILQYKRHKWKLQPFSLLCVDASLVTLHEYVFVVLYVVVSLCLFLKCKSITTYIVEYNLNINSSTAGYICNILLHAEFFKVFKIGQKILLLDAFCMK